MQGLHPAPSCCQGQRSREKPPRGSGPFTVPKEPRECLVTDFLRLWSGRGRIPAVPTWMPRLYSAFGAGTVAGTVQSFRKEPLGGL